MRMGRLVRDDRKATVTQIITHYNQGMQNTISECTTRQTLKQMGYSSRRPHRVLLWSAKNRKLRLQLAQAHQNWTIQDWKNVVSYDESQFLLRHSDGRVRIWHKEHESMDPSCLVSTVQAGGGGVMVWGIFSSHFGPLSTNWALFKLHSLPEYCCWPILIPLWLQCTHLLMATSSRIMHHVTKFKSSQTGFLNMTMCSLYSNCLCAPLVCGGTGDPYHGCAPDKSVTLTKMSIWTKISEECFQHLVESILRRIKAVLLWSRCIHITSVLY